MNRRKLALLTRLVLVVAALSWGADLGRAQAKDPAGQTKKLRGTTQAQRKAAAANKKKAGLTPAAAAALAPLPGWTPDYFGPYPNWANGPLPMGPVKAVALTSGGSGYCDAPTDSYAYAYPYPNSCPCCLNYCLSHSWLPALWLHSQCLLHQERGSGSLCCRPCAFAAGQPGRGQGSGL